MFVLRSMRSVKIYQLRRKGWGGVGTARPDMIGAQKEKVGTSRPHPCRLKAEAANSGIAAARCRHLGFGHVGGELVPRLGPFVGNFVGNFVGLLVNESDSLLGPLPAASRFAGAKTAQGRELLSRIVAMLNRF